MNSGLLRTEKRNLLRINWTPTEKQAEAFELLEDDETTELFFGGGAGGGKSYLGCVWLLYCCLRYPGSRWLMGRAILKDLKNSTLLTFFSVCKEWGIKKDKQFEYRAQEGIIRFFNGSEIYLKDLYAYPSDPEFDSLGSTEYTGAFIDEGSQITVKAWNILKSRIRYKLEEFGLIPKTLIASNPSKNFLYYDFYKPYKEGTLPVYRKFVRALVKDNPFISKYYIENLKKLDKISKERLLLGNFEYDDDPYKLMEYDDILSLFTNTPEKSKDKYLIVDVARFGDDRTVITYWEGLFMKNVWVYSKQDLLKTEKLIEEKAIQYQVKRNNILVDEDGIGGGIVDHMIGVKGFVNNSKPIENEDKDREHITHNFINLKSQCYFRLAEYVRLGKIGIYKDVSEQIKNELIEELEQIKRKDPDKDGKLAVVGKDVIRENIGRSTDLADAFMMRMYFELKKKATGLIDWD